MFKASLLAAAAFVAPVSIAYAQAPAPTQPPARPAPTPTPPAAQTPARPAGQTPPAETTVEGVTVTTSQSAVRSSVDRLSYSVANDLQTATGSVADALRNVPGVEVDVQGNVSLRGDPSVTILIDGRPSALFQGEGRADALQQLGADQVERVEVITNPSAALSPEGTGGVINLVTKRTRRAGRSGSVRASVGTEGRANASVSGSYTGQKLTVSANAGYRKAGGEFTDERLRTRLDPATGAEVGSSRNATRSNQAGGGFGNGRLSADYDVTPRDRLSAEATFFQFGLKPEGVTTFEAFDADRELRRATDRIFENAFANTNGSVRGSWRRTFAPEHELTADLTYNVFGNTNEADIREVNLTPAGPDVFEAFDNTIDRDEQRAKLEYSRPLGQDRKLKIGYEGVLSQSEFDFERRRGPSRQALAIDPNFTNQFAFDQDVHAAYGTFERPFGEKLTVLFGLRMEQVNTEIDQITTGARESNDYFRVYPTLNLGYELSDSQQIRAGYNRRVQRPQPFDLNPFPVFVDEQNRRAGNPRLEPEVTDSFEISYQYRRQANFYLATLFYRKATDGITDVIRPIGDGVFLTTRENLAESRRAGLELVANGRFTPKLTYNVSASLGWTEIEPTGLFGVTETRSGTSIGGRGSLNWTPTDKDFFQVNGFLIGEQLQAQGVREPSGILSLGYRRKVDERLSLVLTAQNVLDSFRNVVRIDTPTLRDRVETNFLQPSVFVGFVFNFGQTQGNRGRPEPVFEFDQGGAPPG